MKPRKIQGATPKHAETLRALMAVWLKWAKVQTHDSKAFIEQCKDKMSDGSQKMAMNQGWTDSV